MDNYTLILDYIDHLFRLYSFCLRMADMAFKRSAVRSRLSPPKTLKSKDFKAFFVFCMFLGVFLTSAEPDIFGEISNTYNTTYNWNIIKRDIKDGIDKTFLLFLLHATLIMRRGCVSKNQNVVVGRSFIFTWLLHKWAMLGRNFPNLQWMHLGTEFPFLFIDTTW